MAAADYNALVQELYISYFGRPADPRGLENFSKALDALHAPTDIDGLVEALASPAGQNTTLKSLINNSFSNSDEAKALYTNADNLAFVGQIYKNVLNRVGDADGLIYWANKLDNHELSRENAAIAIMQGALANDTEQGLKDAALVNAKVEIAGNFTTAIDTGDELLAYSGNAAAATARDMLGKVTSTTTATAFQATVNSTLQGLVNNANPGQTFNLTQGLDTIVGTSNNDKINAFAFNATTGADTTTLNSVDTIDGGAGTDTLFIEVKGAAAYNAIITGSITNVENIVIDNTGNTGAAPAIDASKFVGATNITQVTTAGAVTKLGAATTATFQGQTAGPLAVTAAAATANVAFNGVLETVALNVDGSTLGTVNLSGTRVDGADAGSAVGALTLGVTAGKDVQTINVNSSVDANVTVTDTASTKKVTTFNAAGSSGKIGFTGDAEVTTITGGSGNDTLTLATTTVKAATGVTAVTGTINGGAGGDTITVSTTGDGLTNVDAGAGNDTVNVTTRGTGKLTVALGDGVDTFTSAQAIQAGDSIDAGAGLDTLALSLVGSANIGAFSGFDVFDAANLGHALDVDILATKNTVTEFIASDDVGTGAVLSNIGANVGFRVTGDLDVANAITLNQKTADAITITMNIEESDDADTASTDADAAVITNATAVNVVFNSSFADEVTTAGSDNQDALTLTATAAKTLTVASGGSLVDVNNLTLGNGHAALTTITVTGDTMLNITSVGTGATKLATIDASAATGGLTASLASVIDGGTIKLGSGVDAITVTSASTVATGAAGVGPESVVGFEKAAAAAIGTDATAKTAAIADADTFVIAGGQVADAATTANAAVTAKGVITFTGAGPATLAEAVTFADGVTAANEVAVFQYLSDTYLYVHGTPDTLVKLTGVTGVTNIVEDGTTDHFFIV